MTKIFYANNLLFNHVVYSVLTIRRFHLLELNQIEKEKNWFTSLPILHSVNWQSYAFSYLCQFL